MNDIKKRSGFVINIDGRQYEIIINQQTKEQFLERLNLGRSFYIEPIANNEHDLYGVTFNIEEAVKLQRWLAYHIKMVKQETDYFNNNI